MKVGVTRAECACVALCALGVLARVGMGQGAQDVERPNTSASNSAAVRGGSANPTSPSAGSSGSGAAPIPTPIGDPLAGLQLVPIDPGTEDVAPLWEGGRQMPIDLRKPLNFEQVYRVEGDLSRLGVLGVVPAAGETMYARASGGLIAMFPQSEYVRTKQGPFPVVPANTTFLLGSIQTPTGLSGTKTQVSELTAASAAQRVDRRANATAPVVNTPNREPASIWNSEVARRSRLSQLLDQVKVADAAEEPDAPAPTKPAPDQKRDSEPTPASDP